MHRRIWKNIKKGLHIRSPVGKIYRDINPEDIFLDSANLPGFDEYALEGRIERPMESAIFMGMKIALVFLVALLIGKLWILSVKDGEVYAQISDRNRLAEKFIFAHPGGITDPQGVELAINEIKGENADFAGRLYAPFEGLAHVVGYIKYPKADKSGVYYETEYRPKDGAESAYDEVLRGKNGEKLVETDVAGAVTSESVVEKPVDGKMLVLSLDAQVTETMYKAIESRSEERR